MITIDCSSKGTCDGLRLQLGWGSTKDADASFTTNSILDAFNSRKEQLHVVDYSPGDSTSPSLYIICYKELTLDITYHPSSSFLDVTIEYYSHEGLRFFDMTLVKTVP